jgi:hypothetical protein
MDTPNALPLPTRKTPLPRVTILGATVALLIPLAAVALLFWATRSTPTQDTLSAEQKLHELQATEERQMTTYDWIDKQAGVVRIPVVRARNLILKEVEKKP